MDCSNYWGTMLMTVFTFLERYDFSDKIIRPFYTHDGNGFESSLFDSERESQCRDRRGLSIQDESVNGVYRQVEK